MTTNGDRRQDIGEQQQRAADVSQPCYYCNVLYCTVIGMQNWSIYRLAGTFLSFSNSARPFLARELTFFFFFSSRQSSTCLCRRLLCSCNMILVWIRYSASLHGRTPVQVLGWTATVRLWTVQLWTRTKQQYIVAGFAWSVRNVYKLYQVALYHDICTLVPGIISYQSLIWGTGLGKRLVYLGRR